jgi:CHAT domain-containing protein/tetratricopeptide (TPR) repeat protein
MCTLDRLRKLRIGLLASLILSVAAPASAGSQEAKFVAPARTVSDITAIIDQQKPDPALLAKSRTDAEAEPDAGAPAQALANFYFRRAQARHAIGRLSDAITDDEKAIDIGRRQGIDLWPMRSYLAILLNFSGDHYRALRILAESERETDRPGSGKRLRLFNIHRRQAEQLLVLGNLAQAEMYLRKNEDLWRESRNWPNMQKFSSYVAAETEWTRAYVLEARGRYLEAEDAYRKAEALWAQALVVAHSWPNPPTHGTFELGLDSIVARGSRVKALQGRLAEAEADARRALISRLKQTGRYNPDTPSFIIGLAIVVLQQARSAEAENLARAAINTLRTLGFPENSERYAGPLNILASALQRQGHYAELTIVFAQLDEVIKDWDPKRGESIRINATRVYMLYNTNHLEQGVEIARSLVTLNTQRLGEKHFDTALARGWLAVGLSGTGRDREAIEEFRASIPTLMSVSRLNDDDSTDTTARDVSLQSIIEPYISLLARAPQAAGGDAAMESFRLADIIRGRPVQKALFESSARATARDPALSALARKEQDLQRELGAQFGLLNNVLALSPEDRDDKLIATLRAGVDKLRVERVAERAEIARKFPSYDNLIDPRSPSVEEIRAVLKPDEAVLSFYFGGRSSFVWAVPKDGPVAFSQIKASAGSIGTKIKRLRSALEPMVSTIADIPPFDIVLAHELYAQLLQPVEAGWKSAKNLIVVTNGALGSLPLGLLPTAAVQIDANAEPLFVGYRDVPWLARTHAVTMVPSASALMTLRRLPAASASREKLIGFGDPIFSREQMQEAAPGGAEAPIRVSDATTRGVGLKLRSSPLLQGIDHAELALLPRLPDTAEELKSIAFALNADPSKVLNLGIKANEQTVKSTDLSKYKIIVFATHGLVPGDLDGLTQPALALTAPSLAGVDGDGLLTMEEILGLKLDADWVVLSACNTGAGAGAGAEAASGLGSAFFYAGTRAVLVTNWAVESVSARELVTDLFRRQAGGARLTGPAALKDAMNALIDGAGATDASGKTVYAYAHPLFWAPYTIIGDGG